MNAAIIGTQWGDEGKGKIVDKLAPFFEYNGRGEGAHNAGHTIIHKGEELVLHLIPSAITHLEMICLLGSGMVIDARAFTKEIELLTTRGISLHGRLFVSMRAALITPRHTAIEKSRKNLGAGTGGVGTTMRGVGPAYEEHRARTALRVGDVTKPDFKIKLTHSLLETPELTATSRAEIPALVEEYMKACETLALYATELEPIIANALQDRSSFELEGAQAHNLGVNHGTYPYVTSSSCTAAGLCEGLGFPINRLDSIVGVAKAYTTRVGGGPFATELFDEVGQRIQTIGREIGASTGRARRTGWFDAPVVRQAAITNGVTELALTKLDILTGFSELKICSHYLLGGRRYDHIPWDMNDYANVEPVYVTLPGWTEDISSLRRFNELPENCLNYIRTIEDLTCCQTGIISVGPAPEQTIFRVNSDFFEAMDEH